MMHSMSSLGWLPALFDIAVVSLDSAGTVLECSEPAVAVLSNGGLSISEGKLVASDANDQILLQRMLERAGAISGETASARAAAAGERATPGSSRQTDGLGSPSFVGAIHISRPEPVPPLQVVMTTADHAPEREAARQPAVMLFLCDPARQHSSRSQVLRSLYRLTPTEMRLIDQLVAGAKLKNAAKALNLTENTARFHLKEVFRKMRVDCQSALLSTILLLPSASDVTASMGAYGVGAAGYSPELASAADRYKISASLKARGAHGVNRRNEYSSPGKMFA